MSTTYAPHNAAPSARPARRAVHLTRRGRVAMVALLLMVALAAFAVGRTGMSSASAGSAAAEQSELGQTVVQSGDTLWSVAQELAPGRDTRLVVRQIEDLNGLRGGGLRAGQLLLLPAVG